MTETLAALPRRRPEIAVGPGGDDGRHVIKDQSSGAYFRLGPEESFLLGRLDGVSSPEVIRADFELRFGNPLSGDDLDGFLELAREQGFLDQNALLEPDADSLLEALRSWPLPGREIAPSTKPGILARFVQDPFFLTIPLFDPHPIFQSLEPRLRFVWTRGFLASALVTIAAGGCLAWIERAGLASQLPEDWGWRTVVLAWLVVAVVTTCHEFAHGLTCKHYGGEVRDVGFLLMFFMPCFYCDVSDTWLFPEKWKRLMVTLAGAIFDLTLWSLSVFVWRLTTPSSLLNQIAWLICSVCGVRTLLNINPLIKLDGYYFLSDWLNIPNLRQRGLDRFKGMTRAWLWGAERPDVHDRSGLLLIYGVSSWTFSVVLLGLMLGAMIWFLGARLGWTAVGAVLVLGAAGARGLFRDFSAGEVSTMLKVRPGRATTWAVVGLATVLSIVLFPYSDKAGGDFHIRPSSRAALRAPVAGFLREVNAGDGGWVSVGGRVARLEVPDLDSRTAQKRAEIAEARSRLKLLRVGPRPEQVEEERSRVARAVAWRNLAQADLERARTGLREEIAELEGKIQQSRAERERAADAFQRCRSLMARRALEVESLREAEKALRVADAQLVQSEARLRARQAEGTLKSESELARRDSERAATVGALRIVEAGTRPEEIEAEASRLARLEEEMRYLERLSTRLAVVAPITGVITTPRLEEKVGRFFQEGELIAEVEAPSRLEVEVSLAEHDVARVKAGMDVSLKVRALPFHSFTTRVDRLATVGTLTASAGSSGSTTTDAATASATSGQKPGTFIVYCPLNNDAGVLRTGMTGYARITVGDRRLGEVLALRAYRLIRNEFWW